MPRNIAFTVAALLAGYSLVAAPLAAQQQTAVKSISQSDKAAGAKVNPDLIAEFGGAVTGSQATYVESVGKTIALQSGLGNARNDFNVTLLNSPINNAFAIPGGYVYVTRQLVALMNNEAELAGVLGHEVAHVAARHSAKRQKTQTRNSIFGVLGTVLSGVLLGDGALGQLGQQIFSQGSQALTASFSRSQETQADNLGIQYLRGAGYDPRAMSTVLASLAAQNALDARLMGSGTERAPQWASTHPDPASRVRAAATRAGNTTAGVINRDVFLQRIDGILYGDDPKQGVVEGQTFVHPEFRLAFQAPNGFFLVNGTRSVSISGQSGKGELSTAPFDGSLDRYVRSIFAGLTQQGQAALNVGAIQRTTVNGLPAAYGTARVASGNGQVDATVFAYQFSNSQAFHFVTLTPAGRGNVFSPLYSSMRRISANEAAAVKPRRIDVVTARAGDTVQSLASRMAYSNGQLERFLVLNGLDSRSRIMAGQKVKIVTF